MKKLPFLAVIALALSFGGAAWAEVVRPAPNFAWAPGKTLAQWKGQPVVLVIAPSPRSREFEKQAQRIAGEYQRFAARNVVFVAAFTSPEAANEPIRCNVPFVVAPDGPRIAAAYGANGGFKINVIGRDGNLDLSSAKVIPASRIMDMIINNAAQQEAERKRAIPAPGH